MTQTIPVTEGQLLQIEETGGSSYTIGKVTEKAIMIECSDGRWGGDGFKPLWIPKSQINFLDYDDSRQNSQFGIHIVSLPAWFINQNRKMW